MAASRQGRFAGHQPVSIPSCGKFNINIASAAQTTIHANPAGSGELHTVHITPNNVDASNAVVVTVRILGAGLTNDLSASWSLAANAFPVSKMMFVGPGETLTMQANNPNDAVLSAKVLKEMLI